MKATCYNLINVLDGHRLQDQGWTIADPQSQGPSLVKAEYETREFTPDPSEDGLYRYHNWLPVKRSLKGSCAPVTYKSKGLAEVMGLSNLYITLSGWYPEVGARFSTCTFKETEAYSVCARLDADEKRVLVVASAGNTARAFAQVCSSNRIPVVISIPADNMQSMWFAQPLDPCVKIICSPAHSDYFDAITLADKLCTDPMFLAEGGAKNIARRDGMGTTLLSALEAIGTIPDAYFQAVGSGTGAIAVWENNLRLIEDSRFGYKKMRLMTAQNCPFCIMTESWKQHSRKLVDISADDARNACEKIKAKVLSNRKPPYSLAGGLFDALEDTNGNMYAVNNEQLDKWAQTFEEKEGVDLNPAAAVAVAALAQAVENGDVNKDDIIMLNITGAGEKKIQSQLGNAIFYAKPALVLDPEADAAEIVEKVKSLF